MSNLKDYWFSIGVGDPSTYTGLTPSFTVFNTTDGAATPPVIDELPVGSGLYHFQYGATMGTVFVIDAGVSVDPTLRYVKSTLDPIQAVDLGLGFSSDSYGDTTTDPTTVFGLLKRSQEMEEGNSIYDKSTGILYFYPRGASTAIQIKTISNTSVNVTKS